MMAPNMNFVIQLLDRFLIYVSMSYSFLVIASDIEAQDR